MEIDIIISKKIKEDFLKHYKEFDIADHIHFYINLSSCECRKKKHETNNFIIKTIYEYY